MVLKKDSNANNMMQLINLLQKEWLVGCNVVVLTVLFFCQNTYCEEVDSIVANGITWKFENKVLSGQFINGDYYIVGPAKIVSINPIPTNNRNGSILNVVPNRGKSGFDIRLQNKTFYDSTLRTTLPCTIKPGDAIVSSISVDSVGKIERFYYPGKATVSPVKGISVLTCLESGAPIDAFRPSFYDRKQKLYYGDSIKWDLLPNLPKPKNVTIPSIKLFEESFIHTWYDNCFFGFDAPVSYMPDYGKEIARSVGIATLLLSLDYTKEEKKKLIIGLMQYGIDLWGSVVAGQSGWQAHGGHGNGRKWPIVFTGTLLGNQEMASPTKTFPKVKFSEDMQTMYDECWTGAQVVYGGHCGPEGVSDKIGWGKYEHLPPNKWPRDSTSTDFGGYIGENYRRTATSVGWIGIALSAKLLKTEHNWNHPAFFDYAQRWMTEKDSQFVSDISSQIGQSFAAKWMRQGQTWDPFVDTMWNNYWIAIVRERPGLPRKIRSIQ